MSLYNRQNQNIARGQTYQQEERVSTTLSTFVSQTYQLFAASLLAATVGAFIGLEMVEAIRSWYWGLVIVEIVALVGLMFLKDKPGINLALLFAFTFLTGLTLTPLLSAVLGMPNGASAVVSAFLMTTIIFGAMSVYAMKTSRDLASWGRVLFISVIVILIGSVVNIFLGSPLLQVGIAAIATLIFSLYIAFDTQMLLRGAFSSPVEAAIALYLDVLNIFISLLQLFGILGSSNE
ncbi:MAG: Bax inhibitor-1/YccA family protein [Helicobacter sp.]|nr:Bax inhibitor-1/YccA family protein [Helicobacter sp.]MDE6045131.1 Bax inhibitor-1/YccA family protein [Helicobacter sp.]